MRYFITTNASLNYSSGGLTFPFEPVTQRGGSWLGVLALESNSEADTLIAGGFPQVAEINEARFDDLKKKLVGSRTGSPAQPTGPRPQVPGVAGVAGQSSARGAAAAVDLSKDPNSTALTTSVTLLGAAVTPPHEPLLEQQSPKRPRPVRTKK